jgi:hypothetical protein
MSHHDRPARQMALWACVPSAGLGSKPMGVSCMAHDIRDMVEASGVVDSGASEDGAYVTPEGRVVWPGESFLPDLVLRTSMASQGVRLTGFVGVCVGVWGGQGGGSPGALSIGVVGRGGAVMRPCGGSVWAISGETTVLSERVSAGSDLDWPRGEQLPVQTAMTGTRSQYQMIWKYRDECIGLTRCYARSPDPWQRGR